MNNDGDDDEDNNSNNNNDNNDQIEDHYKYTQFYNGILYTPITTPPQCTSFPSLIADSTQWQVLWNDILTYSANTTTQLFLKSPPVDGHEAHCDLVGVIRTLGKNLNMILTRDYYAALIQSNAYHDGSNDIRSVFPLNTNFLQQEANIQYLKPLLFSQTNLHLLNLHIFIIILLLWSRTR
eukprot:UN07263